MGIVELELKTPGELLDEIVRLRAALEKIVGLAGPSGKTAAHQWGAAFAIANAALSSQPA